MITGKSIFICLFLALPCFNCTKEINSPDAKSNRKLSLHSGSRILKINDSTIVSLETLEQNDTSYTISWSTNAGNIIGSGNKIKYVAPPQKTSAIIKVNLIDSTNSILSDSIEICIYKQLIFLKADDLVFDKNSIISNRWRVFIDFIKNQNIKASLGLIGNSLEKGNNDYYLNLKKLANCGNFEIWNHGYDHLLNGVNESREKCDEFANTPYSYQKEHLLKTQYLAKKKLNIILHTFGAPGNDIDRTTLAAINEIEEIRIWYFGPPESSKLILHRSINLELPVGNPDYQKFLNNYDSEIDYLVLQIHPNLWDENQFEEFKKVVEFLLEKNVTFINPYDYYCLKYSNDY